MVKQMPPSISLEVYNFTIYILSNNSLKFFHKFIQRAVGGLLCLFQKKEKFFFFLSEMVSLLATAPCNPSAVDSSDFGSACLVGGLPDIGEEADS